MLRKVYRGEQLQEISFPLGGIGTGSIGLAGYGGAFALSALAGAAGAWRAVAEETGARPALFPCLTAPLLGAGLAASGGGLMETALLGSGLDSLPAALGGLAFGGLLYWAAAAAMGAGERP